MNLRVLFEDRDVVAVDKPEGLASIPERDLSVASAQRLLEAARGERLFVVHRLDKEVSGLLLFARNAEAHRALSLAFEQRRVHKTYRAVTHGTLEGDRGVIDEPIAEFGSGRMGVHDTRGKPSRTEWSVRRRFAHATEVDAHPVTGRRHQLRVHFYAIGHALLGDPRYGDAKEQARFARLMLHGHRLRTDALGRALDVTCEPPESYRAVIATLGDVIEPGS